MSFAAPSQLSSPVMLLVSLFFVLGGNEAIEPVTAVSSLVFFSAVVLFVWIALPVVRRA